MSMNAPFKVLTKRIINDSKTKKVDDELIQLWNVLFEHVRPIYTEYKIYHMPTKPEPNIILTVTSCKRLDLFKQTINSIIRTWSDLPMVDQFIVIDDNSSDEDRNAMKALYPFITFIMKSYPQRGHLESMNMIYNILDEMRPMHWIHVEDDFLFFERMAYIATGIKGLKELEHFNVKQIMFNRNYIETMDRINMDGHVVYSDNMYSLHDYKPNGSNCQYWPYFSFRPSIIDVSTILELGNFDSPCTFFEMEYAKKWTEAGYKTGFINTVTNIHIGKLCNEVGENAYSLNNVPQFNGQTVDINSNLNIKVINLENRLDRLKNVSDQLDVEKLKFDRVTATDGKTLKLTPELLSMFKNNDFNYRRGIIGCALSHYYLWKQLTESDDNYYLIMEDDVTICKDFGRKVFDLIKKKDYDLLFLGYHMHDHNRKIRVEYNLNNNIHLDNDVVVDKLKQDLYIGGTHCYIITKEGAQALIDFIDVNGIKHGIDYLMAKAQQILPVHETIPHLATAEWVANNDSAVDSDIQYDYNTIPLVVSDNYIFLERLDQIGNDCFVAERHMAKYDYEAMADSVEGCVAFNTLGFFKNAITELKVSPYFSQADGIYVNKDYYFNVFKKKE